MKRNSEKGLPELASGKPSDTTNPAKARRLPKAARLFFGLALLFVLCWALLSQAWHETARREAYLPQLESEARRAPFDGRLHALLGARLMQAGEYTAASNAFRHSIASGEQDSRLWLNLASSTAASGQPALAVADLKLGIRTRPGDADLRRALDDANALGPNPSPAQLARAISPQGPAPLITVYGAGSYLNDLMDWWGRQHPEDSGFVTRQRWSDTQPDNAEVQRLWGLALIRNRRLPEAGAVLEHAVSLAPRSPKAHLALADCLDAAGLSTKATLEYLECLKLHPDWLPALLGVGKTSLDVGLNGYALTSYKRATELAPQSADAWIGLGRAFRTSGVDHDKSVAAFQTAARLAPERTDYYDDYADALRQAVQWTTAESILRKRLQAAPDDALAHYLLGMVLLNNTPTPERQAQAEAETREALQFFPHNALANLQLAQIVLSKGKPAEAIDLLKDALQSSPYNRNAMTVLARAYRQTGQNALAEKISKQADSLYQDQQRAQVLEGQEVKQLMNAGIHEELGRLYGRIGESKKAAYEQNMAKLLRENPRQAAEELQKFQATRSAVLPAH